MSDQAEIALTSARARSLVYEFTRITIQDDLYKILPGAQAAEHYHFEDALGKLREDASIMLFSFGVSRIGLSYEYNDEERVDTVQAFGITKETNRIRRVEISGGFKPANTYLTRFAEAIAKAVEQIKERIVPVDESAASALHEYFTGLQTRAGSHLMALVLTKNHTELGDPKQTVKLNTMTVTTSPLDLAYALMDEGFGVIDLSEVYTELTGLQRHSNSLDHSNLVSGFSPAAAATGLSVSDSQRAFILVRFRDPADGSDRAPYQDKWCTIVRSEAALSEADEDLLTSTPGVITQCS